MRSFKYVVFATSMFKIDFIDGTHLNLNNLFMCMFMMSSLLYQCLRMSNIFLKFSKFWTIWTEKRKKNFLEIISECHEMARNAKKKLLEIFKILAKFLVHLNWKTKKKFFWKSSQNVLRWREMQKKIFGNFQNFG